MEQKGREYGIGKICLFNSVIVISYSYGKLKSIAVIYLIPKKVNSRWIKDLNV